MTTTTEETATAQPTLGELRKAIPAHCFERSTTTSLFYVARDVSLITAAAIIGLYVPSISNPLLRFAAWMAYGYVQGLLFTGLWIVAHECGHGALFNSVWLGDSIGYVLHSFLGVPFFSWRHSHAKHHRYANHVEKDTAFVPRREDEFGVKESLYKALELTEEAPALNLLLLLGHQLLGWPMYLLSHVTAGKQNFPEKKDATWFQFESHFNPGAEMFSKAERTRVILSDIGLLALVSALWSLSGQIGWQNTFFLYGVPYLWVNHWIVAITFLHHNHPSAHHFEPEAWTFTQGALSTVDREFGWIGRKVFHGIIEYHVVHHLFPRLPFYHAEEATAAIAEVLGKSYLRDSTPFITSLWQSFTQLDYVTPKPGDSGILVWHSTMSKPVLA